MNGEKDVRFISRNYKRVGFRSDVKNVCSFIHIAGELLYLMKEGWGLFLLRKMVDVKQGF